MYSPRGFTLIEILVVLGMLALLSTVVLVAINPLRQFAQARETLEFALRLDAENASALMSMAELEIAQGFSDKALGHLRKATEIRQKNPKYLDAYIEAAFVVGAVSDVKKGIQRLKEGNPENQKIFAFEERLKQLESKLAAS